MLKFFGLAALFLLASCTGTVAPEETSTRNVILFIGDGMGLATVTAARIYAGQLSGGTGEEHELSFDRFPQVALVKTYSTDWQVGESSSTITAIVTGEKTRAGLLSVRDEAKRGDCEAARGLSLTTLLEQAEQAGYRTGIVSTAAITHATTAATYAHSAERNWENDAVIPPAKRKQGCRDIARQFLEFDIGDGIEVALGGGRNHFKAKGQIDPEYPKVAGARLDGRDLVAEWLERGENRNYVWNQEQFSNLDPLVAGAVLGLFEPLHMQHEYDRQATGSNEPSLAEMTEFAIGKLQRNGNGFFLLVEAGRIDHAHHKNNAFRALTDTVMLDEAVARALAMTDSADTLILVTADHGHNLTISGYPRRGNPILGKVETAPGVYQLDAKGKPHTTLGYMSGPGYQRKVPDLSGVDTTAPDFRQMAAYPGASGTHSGQDVAAYAHGIGAARLGGVIEQNEIYRVLYSALFDKQPDSRRLP
jgi:alkaline phosphatase